MTYTLVDLEDATEILRPYELTPTRVRRLGGRANSTYRVTAVPANVHRLSTGFPDGPPPSEANHPAARSGSPELDLTVTVCDNTDHLSARWILAVIEGLGEAPFAPPAALVTKDRCADNLVTFAGLPVIVRPYVQGRTGLRLDADDLFSLGSTAAAIGMTEPPAGLRSHRRRLDLPFDLWDPKIAPELNGPIRHASKTMDSSFLRAMPTGLTHGSLLNENLVWTGGTCPVVVDWESASVDYLAYDLATAMVGHCLTEDRSAVDQERCDQILSGYQMIRPLLEIEWKFLDRFARYTATYIAVDLSRRTGFDLYAPDISGLLNVANNGLGIEMQPV